MRSRPSNPYRGCRSRRALARASVALLLGVGSPGCRCAQPVPGAGWIVYAEGDGEQATVWRVRPDGSDPMEVSDARGLLPGPADPFGQGVLAVRIDQGPDVPGGQQQSLWLLGLGGRPDVPLGSPADAIRSPQWKPDGTGLVYARQTGATSVVHAIDRAGAHDRRLTDGAFGDWEPDIGPDGRVVFSSSRDLNAEVYLLDLDGTARRLTTDPKDDIRPRWSPDGRRIAWLSRRTGRLQVWSMAEDGSSPERLRTSDDDEHLDLAWSPDGSKIAVTVQRADLDLDLVVLDVATGEPVGRVGGPGLQEHPAWSPDGRQLAYTRTLDRRAAVWVADADGSAVRVVTEGPSARWLPRWLPEEGGLTDTRRTGARAP